MRPLARTMPPPSRPFMLIIILVAATTPTADASSFQAPHPPPSAPPGEAQPYPLDRDVSCAAAGQSTIHDEAACLALAPLIDPVATASAPGSTFTQSAPYGCYLMVTNAGFLVRSVHWNGDRDSPFDADPRQVPLIEYYMLCHGYAPTNVLLTSSSCFTDAQ